MDICEGCKGCKGCEGCRGCVVKKTQENIVPLCDRERELFNAIGREMFKCNWKELPIEMLVDKILEGQYMGKNFERKDVEEVILL